MKNRKGNRFQIVGFRATKRSHIKRKIVIGLLLRHLPDRYVVARLTPHELEPADKVPLVVRLVIGASGKRHQPRIDLNTVELVSEKVYTAGNEIGQRCYGFRPNHAELDHQNA